MLLSQNATSSDLIILHVPLTSFTHNPLSIYLLSRRNGKVERRVDTRKGCIDQNHINLMAHRYVRVLLVFVTHILQTISSKKPQFYIIN